MGRHKKELAAEPVKDQVVELAAEPVKSVYDHTTECLIIRMEDSLRKHKVGDTVTLENSLFETLESWGFVEKSK